MTQDLKDMCIISKDVLRKWNQTPLVDYEEDVEEALAQDLSGMVVVPLEPTEDILLAGNLELEEAAKQHFDLASVYIYPSVYKAMLSAAQKEKSDD